MGVLQITGTAPELSHFGDGKWSCIYTSLYLHRQCILTIVSSPLQSVSKVTEFRTTIKSLSGSSMAQDTVYLLIER